MGQRTVIVVFGIKHQELSVEIATPRRYVGRQSNCQKDNEH